LKKSLFFFTLLIISNSLLFSNVNNINKDLEIIENKMKDNNLYLKYSNNQKVKLIDAIFESISNSFVLKSAKETLTQAKIKLDSAYAGYKPTLDFEIKDTRTMTNTPENKKKDNGEYSFSNDANYKLTLKQNIYNGDNTIFSIKSLKKKVKSAKLAYNIVLEKEIEKAIKAFFDVLYSKEKVKVNQRNMKKMEKILNIINIRYNSGVESIGNLNNIQASYANAKASLVSVESKLSDSITYYKYIIGNNLPIDNLVYEDLKIPELTLSEIYIRSLENNKELNLVSSNLFAEKELLKGTTSLFKPKIDLEMSYNNVIDKPDFIENDESYKLGISFKYNLYNGDKDKNELLKSYSKIRALKYDLFESKKKTIWNLEKNHASYLNSGKSIKITEEEVLASKNMVDSYWENFQLGEQDLQAMLQAQIKLNTAELALIKYKEEKTATLFSLLKSMGELINFFKLNKNNIDFNNSTFKYSLSSLNNKQKEYIKKHDDIIDTILKEKVVIEKNNKEEKSIFKETKPKIIIKKENILNKINNFKDNFLITNENFYTITISPFNTFYKGLDFINNEKISNNSFVLSYFIKYDKNNKITTSKRFKYLKTINNVVYKSYKNLIDAYKDLNNLEKKYPSYQFSIKKVKDIIKIYKKNLIEAEPKEIILKKRPFYTNKKFKNRFLDEKNSNKYTINLSSFKKLNDVKKIILDNNLYNNSFFFRYGRKGEWFKVTIGIFDKYSKAQTFLNQFPKIISKNFPIIEKIEDKQNLYKKYKRYNKPYTISKKEQEKLNYLLKEKRERENLKAKEQIIKFELKKSLEKDDRKKLELYLDNGIKNIETSNLSLSDTKWKDILKKNKKQSLKIYNFYNNIKTIKTNTFGKKILNTQPNYYTLDFGSFKNKNNLNKFIKQNNLEKISFTFNYGSFVTYTKLVSGIYKTYNEALFQIKKFNNNNIKIKKISKIKTLLYKYINLNNNFIDFNDNEEKKKILKINKYLNIKSFNYNLKKKTYDKLSNNNFHKKYLNTINSKKTTFTLVLSNVDIEYTIKRYLLDENNLTIVGSFEEPLLIYGLFDNKKEALISKFNLHQNLYNKFKIIKIKNKR